MPTLRVLAALAGALACAACGAPPPRGCEPGAMSWCAPDGGGLGRSTCTAERTPGVCEPLPPGDAGPPPPMPALPLPPVFMPCPAGWVERVNDEGITVCDPWIEGSPECTPPRARFPGQAACVDLGTPCPVGDLPDVTPPGAIHVVAGSTAGDGSRASPFGTVSEALAVLAEGGVLVLGRGTYTEAMVLPAGASLIGSCIDDTVISTALPASTLPAIDIIGPGSRVENVHIITDNDGGIRVQAGGSVTVRGVWFDQTDIAITGFNGASYELEDVLITDSHSHGAQAGVGVVATLRRVSILRSYLSGLWVSSLGSVVLEDVYIYGTRDPGGNSVFVEQNATLTGERLVVEDGAAAALTLPGAGSSVTLTHAVFLNTVGTSLAGMRAFGSTIELHKARIEGWRAFGIGVADMGGRLVLHDSIVRSTRILPGDEGTAAIQVVEGASAELLRVVIDDAESVGVLVHGTDAVVQATDLRVSGTRGLSLDGELGRAVQAQLSGAVELERALFEQNREVSLGATSFGRVDGVDVTILGTLPRECAAAGCASAGMGAFVAEGGRMTLESFLIADSALCGAQIAIRGALDLRVGQALRNVIGVCVQVSGYDLSRLTDEVTYAENGSNVDATTLPVPDIEVTLGSL